MVYSRETLLKRFKICIVLGVIGALALGAINIILPVMAGEFTFEVVLAFVYIFVLCVVIFPLQLVGYTINGTFKKMVIGIIAPIPVLSSCIEALKAFYYGIKAAMVVLKKEEALVIGTVDEQPCDEE